MASLTDVIPNVPKILELWRANQVISGSVGTEELFSAFHGAYWGKSVNEEEIQWRNSHPQTTAQTAIDDMMDVDRAEVPGCCFVMDYPLPNIKKIWVREEYVRIYDELERWYEQDSEGEAPGAIVTGQPGIGKSVWVYYALRRRLGEKKAVILYFLGNCLLFVKEGVFKKPVEFDALRFDRIVWTLLDADTQESVPSHLVEHGTRLFVIFVTSPKSSRWNRLHKTTRFTICIMKPWTREEMRHLVTMNNLEATAIETVYDAFGPIPRLWYQLRDPVERTRYERDVKKAITSITSSKLEDLINDSNSLTMDAISHKVCLLSRADDDNPRSQPVLIPITLNIRSMLTNHIRNMERSELIRLFKHFSKVPDSRVMAGLLFEAFGQRLFQEQIAIDIAPMVRLQNVPHGKPQWYSSHAFLSNTELETSRQTALRSKSRLEVKPAEVIASGTTPPLIEEDVYYLPKKTNQVAIDSFIVSGGYLYLFQFTIGDNHPVKPGLKAFLESCQNIPTEDKWRFVFIVPVEETVICPALPRPLDDLPVSSAAIPVE